MKRDLRQTLKAIDARAPEVDARRLLADFRSRQKTRHGTTRVLIAMLAVMPLLASVAYGYFQIGRRNALAAQWQTVEASDDFVISFDRDGSVSVLSGTANVRQRRLRLLASFDGPSTLRTTTDGYTMTNGRVTFEVDKRRADEPTFKVGVSGGYIEVLGTRFDVVESGTSGAVTLHEGQIAFHSNDGQVRLMLPGQTLEWPLAQVSSPEVKSPEHTDVAPVAPVPDVREPGRADKPPPPVANRQVAVGIAPELSSEEIFSRVQTLRQKSDFAEAATLLEGALHREWPEPTWERLSFELGMIQGHQLAKHDLACAHWRAHQRKVPAGRYEEEIEMEVKAQCRQPDEDELTP